MKRDKKLKILLPVLLLISLYVWAPSFQSPKKSVANSQKSNELIASDQKNKHESFNLKNLTPKKRAKSHYQDWGRNPFVFEGEIFGISDKELVEEGLTPQQIVLEGIVYNQSKPSVIIANKVLGIGAIVGVNTIKEIKKNKVIFNNGMTDFELGVGQR